MEATPTPIETKEIRGITFKTIIWLLACTVSIVSSVVITSSNISNKLETYIIKQDGVNAIQDMKIGRNEEDVDRNEDEINHLKEKFDQLNSKIKIIP